MYKGSNLWNIITRNVLWSPLDVIPCHRNPIHSSARVSYILSWLNTEQQRRPVSIDQDEYKYTRCVRIKFLYSSRTEYLSNPNDTYKIMMIKIRIMKTQNDDNLASFEVTTSRFCMVIDLNDTYRMMMTIMIMMKMIMIIMMMDIQNGHN